MQPYSELRPRNSVSEFFEGVRDVWRGASFILVHPGLWLWALIPFILNILVFSALGWGLWHFAGDWLHSHLFASGGFWSNLLGWALSILIGLLFLLLLYFLFVPVASLIASPFNDVLSEKVERLYVGQSVDQGFSVKALVKSVTLGLHSSLRLTLVSLALLAAALLLNLLPPPLGPALWTAASAAITIRFLSLQFTSYSMDRRFYTYQQRREFLRRNRARTIGLGSMAFLIMLAPVLNALFIPVSAAAGTLLFCDTQRQG